jgi:Phosphotransferase enzyme family
MDKPEILQGGNSNEVRREGQTVVRKTGEWSPFVHDLLRYLQAHDFKEAPILLEVNEQSERLSFLEGDVGHYPLKDFMREDSIVIEAAKLLRKFHDLTEKFPIPPNAKFFLAADVNDYEVICHNDFAPYNCVFSDKHLVGIIDFDTAAPNKRIWDIAYAVYRFAPLVSDKHAQDMGWQSPPNRLVRLKSFCDAYGLEEGANLIETVIQRLESLIKFMQDTSSNLEHVAIYLEDLNYIRENQAAWTAAIS